MQYCCKVFLIFLIIISILPIHVLANGYKDERSHSHYYTSGFGESGSAEAMAADVLIARPIGLVTTVFGSAVYVISLPFSLLGGNEEQAREKLVKEPTEFTFRRPLGEFPSLKSR